tara:strand:- start:1173 stop:2210 length:1038 start_codon:yes stop_codon:yes gene_type:complete
MSLENTTYIDGLIVTNPTSSDPVSQGDDHLKLIKSTLKNTFPNVTNAVTTTHTEINQLNDATDAATNNALVKRSSSGAANFSTVTATSLAGTLTTAAQTNITSVGALSGGSIGAGFGSIDNGGSAIQTTGTITSGKSVIDSITIDGSNIGHTSDTDLISLSSGAVLVAGSMTAQSISTVGDISVSGNVDGYDISGLQGALDLKVNTADLDTPAEILAKIKTVDGASSGLDAQFLAGNAASAFLTSSDFVSVLSANGYTTLPNGLMFQWGRAASPSGRRTISLNTPFPNNNFAVLITANDSRISGDFEVDHYSQAVDQLTTTSFRCTSEGTSYGSSGFIYFLAIGN